LLSGRAPLRKPRSLVKSLYQDHPASQPELAMTAVEELERVHSLLNKGALTADEATTIKAQIIGESFKGGMPVLDQIDRLYALHQQGGLTADEFQEAKERAIDPVETQADDDAVFLGVCSILGALTPVTTFVWRIIFVSPFIAQFAFDSLIPGKAWPSIVGKVTGATIALYLALWAVFTFVPLPKIQKGKGQ
jgi:hypothetical protein